MELYEDGVGRPRPSATARLDWRTALVSLTLFRGGDPGRILGDREAAAKVRRVLPGLANRRALFTATAWKGFKCLDRAGFVRYIEGPLLRWARAKARAKAVVA